MIKLNPKVKQTLLCISAVALVIYAVTSSIAFIGGILEGGEYQDYHTCYKEPTILKTLHPTFKLGCYLSKPFSQEYYEYQTYNDFQDKKWSKIKEQRYEELYKECKSKLNEGERK